MPRLTERYSAANSRKGRSRGDAGHPRQWRQPGLGGSRLGANQGKVTVLHRSLVRADRPMRWPLANATSVGVVGRRRRRWSKRADAAAVGRSKEVSEATVPAPAKVTRCAKLGRPDRSGSDGSGLDGDVVLYLIGRGPKRCNAPASGPCLARPVKRPDTRLSRS